MLQIASSVEVPSQESTECSVRPVLPYTDIYNLREVWPFRREDHNWITVVCCGCHSQVDVPVKCGNRFCPTCTGSRRKLVRDRLRALFTKVPRLPYRDFRLITLTIPNSKSVKDGSSLLVSAFRRLRQRRWWRKKVYGGVFVIEVTQGKSGFHVHMHIVCQALKIGHAMLKSEWIAVGGGVICDVRDMWNIDASAYLTKYLTKVKGDPDFVMTVGQGLKGRRLYQPFGKWHGLDLSTPRIKNQCRDCGSVVWISMWDVRSAVDITTGKEQYDDWLRVHGILPDIVGSNTALSVVQGVLDLVVDSSVSGDYSDVRYNDLLN